MKSLDYKFVERSSEAWVEFLGQYFWDMWITANFSKHLMNMKPDNAIKFIRESFIKKLYRPGVTISWFAVIEFYRAGGVHAHMLLTVLPGFYSYQQLGTEWRNANGIRSETGLTVIEPAGYFKPEKYDHGRGAGAYVSKYITKNLGAWDFKLNDCHKWDRVMNYITKADCPESHQRVSGILTDFHVGERNDHSKKL